MMAECKRKMIVGLVFLILFSPSNRSAKSYQCTCAGESRSASPAVKGWVGAVCGKYGSG